MLLLALVNQFALGQDQELPEFNLERSEVEAHLRFLASDELQGRKTGEPGNAIAARYLASHFEALGLQKPEGQSTYFQPVYLESSKPSEMGALSIGEESFKQLDRLLITRGPELDLSSAKFVFAEYGWVDEESNYDDYKGLDVKGKIVVTLMGTPEASDMRSIFRSFTKKRELAAARGAVALLEVFQIRWSWARVLQRFKGDSSLQLASETSEADKMVYGWINPKDKGAFIENLKKKRKSKGSFSYPGTLIKKVVSHNVMGIIEGTDPELKKEYVLLSAHFDHVGTTKSTEEGQDTVFNGARDNGMGTVAMLSAVKALSKQKPKRSVVALAVTGEEMGILGSTYFTANPLVPLDQVVFNLNSDCAGYNDVAYLSIVGFGRTGTDHHMTSAASLNNLKVFPNPAPEQGLFDRSDNVAFAAVGIPAASIMPGMTAFDEQIREHYHQVSDEADSIDFDYLLKFCRSFAHLARLISDDPQRPQWKEGDKYEPAAKELYGAGK